jgi:hypothetical protein
MPLPLTDLTADALNAHEPQRQNNMIFHVIGLAGVGGDDDPVDDELVLALESFPAPKMNTGVIEMRRFGEARKYAGNTNYDDMSVVYKDLVSAQTKNILWSWRLLVKNPTTGVVGTAYTGAATGYKRNGYVCMFGPGGALVDQWDCFGIWPSTFDPGDADMTGEDFVRINVTFTIDKVIRAAVPGTPPADYQA